MSTITGYQEDTDGVYIQKDTEAKLTYTLDWVNWLPQGTSLASVAYTHNSRANDADPIIIHSSGIQGTKTYAVISGGTANRVYLITSAITLDNGQTDRRAFKIKVQARLA